MRRASGEILPRAGVAGAGHAAPKRALQARFIDGQTQHIEQAAHHQIGRVTDLVRLAGALHLVRSDLLDHRARLLPGRAAQIQGAAKSRTVAATSTSLIASPLQGSAPTLSGMILSNGEK